MLSMYGRGQETGNFLCVAYSSFPYFTSFKVDLIVHVYHAGCQSKLWRFAHVRMYLPRVLLPM